MQTVVVVIHLMIVLAMIGFVLLQRSEGGGLGMGGGAGGFMSSRGTANVLTRATAFLAIAFFVTSLLLSYIASMDRRPRSILQGGTPSQSAPGTTTPLTPPGGGGLLDTLGGGQSGGQGGGQQGATPAAPAPQTPPAPSGPQVPQSR